MLSHSSLRGKENGGIRQEVKGGWHQRPSPCPAMEQEAPRPAGHRPGPTAQTKARMASFGARVPTVDPVDASGASELSSAANEVTDGEANT